MTDADFMYRQKYIILLQSALSQDPPRDPIGPPSLVPLRGPDNIGQFSVDLSTAAPQHSNSEVVDLSTVVFLFKIEEMDSHNISYNWTVSATNPS